MHGIFAASTGISVQFFPESAVLGCGPDAARAYPYTVLTGAGRVAIRIDAADRPLSLALRPDGSLDAGSGSYQVHGRTVTGQNENGDFTFAPLEQTCSLAVLTPSKEIPSSGSSTATMLRPRVWQVPPRLWAMPLSPSCRDCVRKQALRIRSPGIPLFFSATATPMRSPRRRLGPARNVALQIRGRCLHGPNA